MLSLTMATILIRHNMRLVHTKLDPICAEPSARYELSLGILGLPRDIQTGALTTTTTFHSQQRPLTFSTPQQPSQLPNPIPTVEHPSSAAPSVKNTTATTPLPQ